MRDATPKHCKGCLSLWLKGTRGAWCCKYGKKADHAVGHCVLNNGKRTVLDKA